MPGCPNPKSFFAMMFHRFHKGLVCFLALCGGIHAVQGKAEQPSEKKLNSIHRLLGPSDYDKFRIGRSKDDVLKDVQWRGNFEMACRHKGKRIYGISFEFFSSYATRLDGEVAWAIFIDEK